MVKRIQGEAKPNRKIQGFEIPAGPSILESVETQLRKAIDTHHRILKDDADNEVKVNQTRGVVRGLAFAVLTIRAHKRYAVRQPVRIAKPPFVRDGVARPGI